MSSSSSSSSIRCIVYLEERRGRLGNRMFMIASAYGLARIHDCHLCFSTEIIEEMRKVFVFDLPPFFLSQIMLNSSIDNGSEPWIRISRFIGCEYVTELVRPDAIHQGYIFELRGFWQSYLYFAKHINEFREHIFAGAQPVVQKVSQFFIHLYQKQFRIKPDLSNSVYKTLKQQLTNANETTWIGIHVRRTDIFSMNFSSSAEYLFDAIAYFTNQYPNAHFIVASDDKPYCQKLFYKRRNIFITPESFSAGDDFIALSLCEHSIMTGGTYGWWSAYLANGRVMCDTAYIAPCKKREHYYPPWFLLNDKV